MQNIILQPATTVTASGTGTAVSGLGEWRTICMQLDLSAAADATEDECDVYLQTLVGSTWVDVYRFTKLLGDGGPKRYFGKLTWDTALTEFESGAALDAAASRSLCGDSYRVRWAVIDDSEAASFTFSLRCNVLS